jgi:hypothetical protein
MEANLKKRDGLPLMLSRPRQHARPRAERSGLTSIATPCDETTMGARVVDSSVHRCGGKVKRQSLSPAVLNVAGRPRMERAGGEAPHPASFAHVVTLGDSVDAGYGMRGTGSGCGGWYCAGRRHSQGKRARGRCTRGRLPAGLGAALWRLTTVLNDIEARWASRTCWGIDLALPMLPAISCDGWRHRAGRSLCGRRRGQVGDITLRIPDHCEKSEYPTEGAHGPGLFLVPL